MHFISVFEGEELKSTRFSPTRVDMFNGMRVPGNEYPAGNGWAGLLPNEHYRVLEMQHRLLKDGETEVAKHSFVRVERV